MRLNNNSMSKLYDLIVMGVKQQLMNAKWPGEILHMTKKHLENMKMIVIDTEACEAIKHAISCVDRW